MDSPVGNGNNFFMANPSGKEWGILQVDIHKRRTTLTLHSKYSDDVANDFFENSSSMITTILARPLGLACAKITASSGLLTGRLPSLHADSHRSSGCSAYVSTTRITFPTYRTFLKFFLTQRYCRRYYTLARQLDRLCHLRRWHRCSICRQTPLPLIQWAGTAALASQCRQTPLRGLCLKIRHLYLG